MIGKKFNRLKVKSFSHKVRGHRHWICICDCGNIKIVGEHNLTNNHTKSCGCLQKESVSKANRSDLLRQRFGKLTVVKLDNVKNNECFWECICDCGKNSIVVGYNLTGGNTKSCGCLRKENMNKRKGKLHPNWRHDLSQTDRKLNKDRSLLPRHRTWTKRVFERDNYTCVLSGQRGGKLSAHHLSGWDVSPSMRFRTNNGITISKDIHDLFHNLYKRGNNTKKQFQEFTARYENGEFKNILTTRKNNLNC